MVGDPEDDSPPPGPEPVVLTDGELEASARADVFTAIDRFEYREACAAQ